MPSHHPRPQAVVNALWLLILSTLASLCWPGESPFLVRDINTNHAKYANPSSIDGVDQLYGLGGSVYFRAPDLKDNRGLWKSDGTYSGTTLLLKDWLGNICISHNTVYFSHSSPPPLAADSGKPTAPLPGRSA